MNSEIKNLVPEIDGVVSRLRERPSWDAYFMATALLISSRSACERLHVGCVIVSSGEHPNRIIAAGYNGFLPGAPHASCVREGHEQATVHAEQNAISDAAKRGVSVMNATVYVTHFPCVNCAKILASAGIREIKFLHDYKNDALVPELLAAAKIKISKISESKIPRAGTTKKALGNDKNSRAGTTKTRARERRK